MTSLSERFGRIKAVTFDSTESETDFSDDSLFPKRNTNTFNFSNTPTLSFTPNFNSKIVDGIHKECDDDSDDDDEVLDMESNWRQHFLKILVKSRSLSGKHEKHDCLSDNIPEINNSLPLKYLKNSIEQYNRLSQLSDDVDEKLTTNDDLILERNENEFDTCNVNTATECDNTADFQIDADIEHVALGDVHTNVVNDTADAKESITEDAVTDAMPDGLGHPVDTGTVSLQHETELSVELGKNSEIKARNELSIPFAQKIISKTKQDINEEENGDSKNQTDKYFDEIESVASVGRKENNVIIQEPLQSILLDHEESGERMNLKESQTSEITKSDLTKPKIEKGANVVTQSLVESLPKELSDVSVDKGESSRSLMKAKSQDKETDLKAFDTLVSKQDEKSSKINKSEPQVETKRHMISDKSNKDKIKSSVMSKSKKVPSKVKTHKIEQTFSFPLDELLPPVLPGSQKTAKEVSNDPVSVHRKTEDQTTEATTSAEIIPNPETLCTFNESDVFHGTVYNNSPNDERPSEAFQNKHRSFEDGEKIAEPGFSGVHDLDEELDIGMANLISALQSGDQQVVKLFQAALNDQIGSNLKALASRARSSYQKAIASKASNRDQVDPLSEREEPPSFGFYTETKRPDETGDNPNNEKYDDLLDLLVEQCSGLVQTEEDSSKLKYLVKFLQKENEMKFKDKGFTPSSGFTPPTKVEDKVCPPDNNSSLEGDQTEIDLFEGRTLLKGGVDPRHIPKTTVRKSGLERPKDPRVKKLLENKETKVKLPLPAFAVELYGEKMVKRILHLDWDAQFCLSGNVSSSVNEKDPRIKKKLPIDSHVIGGETKSLVESLTLSNEALSNKHIQENKTKSNMECPSIDKSFQNFTLRSVSSKKAEVTSSKTIPVLITSQEEVNFGVKSVERNSVLLSIDLQNSLPAAEQNKPDKKVNIGIVKPLIEKQTIKDTKPSIGIVKPIQMKSTSVKQKSVMNKEIINTKKSFDNKKCEIKGNKELQTKLWSSKTNKKTDPIVIDSDSEEGEISMAEKTKAPDKTWSKPISKSHKNTGKNESKCTRESLKTAPQCQKGKVQNTNIVNTSFSDVSSYEDGEIDSLLDKSFSEKHVIKKHSRGEKKSITRSYRKRDRSTSRSSIDSRMSHSSNTNYRQNDRKHKHSPTRHTSSISKSKEKSRSDRSRSTDISDTKSYSNETRNPSHKHRHRNQSRKEDKSSRDYSNKSESSKRYHSLGNVERKRHKTDEDCKQSCENQHNAIDNFKSRVSSINDTTYGRKFFEKTRVSETVSYQHNEESLSDDEISKEYHDFFGKKAIKTERIDTDRDTGISSSEYDLPFQGKSKIRRKSTEDKQKEVLEDKKFLESFKKKCVGYPSKGNKKLVEERDKNYNYIKQVGPTTQKSDSVSAQSSDLEEGEI